MSIPVAYRVGDPLDPHPFRRCTSMSNGHFRIPFLPDGQYIITTFHSGRQEADASQQVPVTISGGETARGVDLGKP